MKKYPQTEMKTPRQASEQDFWRQGIRIVTLSVARYAATNVCWKGI